MQFWISSSSVSFFAVDIAGDQVGQDIVVARVAPTVGDQAGQVVGEFGDRIVAPARHVFGQGRLKRAQNRQRPTPQWFPVLARYAKHVADDLDRQGGGEILDQIHVAARFRLVQKPVDQCDEAGFQHRKRARREGGPPAVSAPAHAAAGR